MAMKTRTLIAGAAVTLTAAPLLANNNPGPQMMLAEVSLLPLMIVLTLAGGGYTVLRRFPPGVRLRWKVIGAIVAVFFSAVTESFAVLVAIVFGWIATLRAIRMIGWGIGGTEAPLTAARRARLVAAGAALLVAAIFLTGMAVAFVGATPWSDEDRIASLRKYVALRLALRTPPSPQRAALEKNAAEYEERLAMHMGRWQDQPTKIEEHGEHFVVYLKPNVTNNPFPPYNRFFSVPSYRADETGLIRRKLVHARDDLCPPDAPIVGRVNDDEIRAVLKSGKVD
jgi:hypothetical protein